MKQKLLKIKTCVSCPYHGGDGRYWTCEHKDNPIRRIKDEDFVPWGMIHEGCPLEDYGLSFRRLWGGIGK